MKVMNRQPKIRLIEIKHLKFFEHDDDKSILTLYYQ